MIGFGFVIWVLCGLLVDLGCGYYLVFGLVVGVVGVVILEVFASFELVGGILATANCFCLFRWFWFCCWLLRIV